MARWAVVGNITSQTFAFASGPLYPVGELKPQSGLIRFNRAYTRLVDFDRVEVSLRDRLRRKQMVLVLLSLAELRKYKAAGDLSVPKNRIINSVEALDAALSVVNAASTSEDVDTDLDTQDTIAAPAVPTEPVVQSAPVVTEPVEESVPDAPAFTTPAPAAEPADDELSLDGPPPVRPVVPSREELEAMSYADLRELARSWDPPITSRAKSDIIDQLLG